MKKNAIRLKKLEDKLVGNRSDLIRLSDLEILERIEALEFQEVMRPTQKFMDMKKSADRTKPVFTPKVSQHMREKQAERNAEIASMNELEFQGLLSKLVTGGEMKDTFEDISEQELDKYNKTKKETLV